MTDNRGLTTRQQTTDNRQQRGEMMDKREQIRRVEAEFDALMTSFEGMDEAALTQPGMGEWSVREVLAHVAGWFELDAELMRRIAAGEHPLPDGGEAYGSGETRNPEFARVAATKMAAVVIEELRGSFAGFIAAAEALPEERFAEGRMSQRILQGNGWEHMGEHRAKIEAYRRRVTLS
jgi:hypothetical protein